MKYLSVIATTLIVFGLSCCKKEEETPNAVEPHAPLPAAAGNFNINFKAMVGDSDLVFNTETYTSHTGAILM